MLLTRIAVLFVAAVAGSPAMAQAQKMDVGRGVLCETPQQIERFVALRAGGKEAEIALRTLNEEIKGAAACRFSFVIFTGGSPVANMSVNGRPASIVEITVHAFGDGAAWREVPAAVWYTVAVEKGLIA